MDHYFNSRMIFWYLIPVAISFGLRNPLLAGVVVIAFIFRRQLPDPLLWMAKIRRISILKATLESNPHDLPAAIELAEAYLKLRSYARAETLLATYATHAKADATLLYTYGLALFGAAKYANAVKIFRDIAQVDAKFRYGDALRWLAQSEFCNGELENSEKTWLRFLQVNGSSVQGWYRLAEVRKKLGDQAGYLAAKQEGISTYRQLLPYLRRAEFMWHLRLKFL